MLDKHTCTHTQMQFALNIHNISDDFDVDIQQNISVHYVLLY